jgi:hypothetical protein
MSTAMGTRNAQGAAVWIKHEEVRVQAEIVTSNEKEITAKTDEDPDARIVLGADEPIFLRQGSPADFGSCTAWRTPDDGDCNALELPRRTNPTGESSIAAMMGPTGSPAASSARPRTPTSAPSGPSTWTPPPGARDDLRLPILVQQEHDLEISSEAPTLALMTRLRSNSTEPLSGTSQAVARAPARQEYCITIDRTSGDKLGIDIDDSDGVKLVVKDIKPGLIHTWNITNPCDSWVHLEDQIIEVNGVSGNADMVFAECAKTQVLHMRMQPVLVKEDGPLVCLNDNAEVFVHIYDLWGASSGGSSGSGAENGRGQKLGGMLIRGINAAMPTRLGLYHTGVEVYGREWCFCGTELGSGMYHGVWAVAQPKQSSCHRYRRTIAMGRTKLTRADLEELMPLLRLRWPGWTYHPFRHNCHHFSNAFCKILGFSVGPKCGLFADGDPRLEAQEEQELSPTQPHRSRPTLWGCCGICGKGRRPNDDDDTDMPLTEQAPIDIAVISSRGEEVVAGPALPMAQVASEARTGIL